MVVDCVVVCSFVDSVISVSEIIYWLMFHPWSIIVKSVITVFDVVRFIKNTNLVPDLTILILGFKPLL